MPRRLIKTLLALPIFLFFNLFYLSAQEKQDAKEEVIQRYLQEQESSLAVAQPQPAPEIAEERQYYIDLGDILDISVWQV